MPRTGETSLNDCLTHTIMILNRLLKIELSKNWGRKKTAFNCGELSPVLNGFSRPPSMFRGAVIVVGVVVLVKRIFEIDALTIEGS